MGAAPGVECDLEETVQNGVKVAGFVTAGVGLADLVENLVLAQDRAVKAAGDVDEVACGSGVLQP
jgi:hypothetical protein